MYTCINDMPFCRGLCFIEIQTFGTQGMEGNGVQGALPSAQDIT